MAEEQPWVKARQRRSEAGRKAAAARWAGHVPKKRREPRVTPQAKRPPGQVHPLVRQLLQAREAQGMSKRELSRRAGLSKGHVDSFERGRISASVLYSLSRLGDVLGLRLAWVSRDGKIVE